MIAPPPAPNRKAVAFCWQSKAALRLIREQVPDYGSAIAVYVALSVIASDKESPEFQTTHQWIESLCGFGNTTVKLRLKELERIGLVKITTPALKAPCTYHLLTIGDKRLTLGAETPPANAYIRRTEEQKRDPLTPRPSAPLTTPQRITLEGKLRLQRERVDKLRHLCSDRLEVQENPGLIVELKEAEAFLTNLENQLLNS